MTARLAAPAIGLVMVGLALSGGAFEPWQRVAAGSALAVVAALAVRARSRRLDGPEILGLAFLGVATTAAVSVGTAWLAGKETLASWALAWVLWVATRAADPGSARRALVCLVAGAEAVAVGVGLSCLHEGSLRHGGLFDNPNLAAAVLLAGLAALVALAGRDRGLRIAAAAPLILALGLSGSRAGLLALVVMGAVLLPPGGPRRVGVLGLAAVAVGLVVLRFVQAPDVLAWHRLAIWRAVVETWLTHPILGVAPGGLADAAGPFRLLHADHVGQRQFLVVYAESTPLALLAQTGLVGLAALATACGLWLRQLTRGGQRLRPLIAGVAAVGVFGLFHDLGSAEAVLWWWAATLGLVECVTRPAAPVETATPRSAEPRWAAAVATGFLVLWGIVQPAWARAIWASGAPSPERAERAMRCEPWLDEPAHVLAVLTLRGDAWGWEEAADGVMWSRRALRVHPGGAQLWANLGAIRVRTAEELGATERELAAADAALATASRLEPWLPWACLERARLARLLGDTDRAVELAETAVRIEPNTARGWLFLARLELDRGRVDAAQDALHRAERAMTLARGSGLSDYERELVAAPDWQLRSLAEALR